MKSIRSYSDTLSYRAGDTISVHCSAEPQEVHVSLKRLVHSEDASSDIPIPWEAEGTYRVEPQESCLGGFASATTAAVRGSALTFGGFFWLASDQLEGPQTLWSLEHDGEQVRVQHEGGRLTVTSAGSGAEQSATIEGPVRTGVWYFLTTTINAGELTVRLVSTDLLRGESHDLVASGWQESFDWGSPTATVAAHSPRGLAISGGLSRGHAKDHFTGKLEGFFVAAADVSGADAEALAAGEASLESTFGGALVAAWDFSPFSAGDDSNFALDTVSGGKVQVVNLPTQAVTGRYFDGSVTDYRFKPEHYAAIHFHSTDMADAGWDVTFEAKLPADIPSGVYAIDIVGEHATDQLPVFVAPPAGAKTGRRVAVMLPTFCYLAYANEGLYQAGDPSSWTSAGEIELSEEDKERIGDITIGLSQYDKHFDESGVAFTSSRRPIINMRRGYQMWLLDAGRGFSADMYLVEWLESRGIEYDILTEYEVHEGGAAVLEPYAAVISGMHPEYPSLEVIDAMQEYRDAGGGLLYLGGNGYYWVTGVYAGEGLAVEIRRGHAGVLTWTSYPGEVTLISGKQPGGLWKYRGRAPQRLVGLGFAAQGWGKSYPFHRNPEAENPEVAWIFEGVEADPIGDYGKIMGGAAGDEIDRADTWLGTPYHAHVVATARVRDNFYQHVPEEVGMTLPSPNSPGGEDDENVKADVVYFKTPNGGEVFSAGSMAWSGSLVINDGENGVSRMTENVVRRFIANRE